MIPLSIELENFRSFTDSGEIPLNFAPLFCIVGENGAGKSSIVEAILWALFGKSREHSRSAIPIRTNADFVRVKFDFEIENRKYRIIRSNGIDGHKILFLKLDPKTNKFVSVVRSHRISDIQLMIENVIGADYQGLRLATVFVQNESAIFSTISPSERRRVLAKLLGIERYEILRKKASRRVRDNEAAIESLRSQLDIIQAQLADISDPTDELEKSKIELDEMKSKLSELNDKLSDAIEQKIVIDSLSQKREVLKKSLESKRGEVEQISNSMKNLENQKCAMEQITEDENEILRLKSEYDEATSRAKNLSAISAERAKILENIDIIKQKINSVRSKHNEKINRLAGEIAQIEQEIEHSREKVSDADFLRKKLDELEIERRVFEELSAKKQIFEGLSKTIIQAQTEIEAEKRSIRERIEQLNVRRKKIENELTRLPSLKKELSNIDDEIKICEQNSEELDRVREKIASINVEISNRTRNAERIRQKIAKQSEQLDFVETEKISRCPLCGSELTGKHKSELIEKLSSEIKSSQDELEQIDNEIKEFHFDRKRLEAESEKLANYSDSKKLRNRYEKISIEIANLESLHERLNEIDEEINELKDRLQTGNFSAKWFSILNKTEDKIKNLDFDIEVYEKVEKMVEQLRTYEKKWEVVNEYINKIKILSNKLENLRNKLAEMRNTSVSADLEDELKIATEKLKSLKYDADEFQKIQQKLDELQDIPQKVFQLQQARDKLPKINKDIVKLKNRYDDIRREISQMNSEIDEIDGKLEKKKIFEKRIDELKTQIDKINRSISATKERRAELKSELKNFNNLTEQFKKLDEQSKTLQKEAELYLTVEKILGPMGIQDWLLQGYLKKLELDANDTLAILSENILKVRLVPESDEKLVIHISDNLGERVYESYSGGEEFRIDFSLRLALSRLLANRAGFPLQTLIIDEGFGSQDENGLSNLVDALYRVQSQFARIIVVTHLTALQNAFPTRLEVKKNEFGSTVRVVA